MATTKIKVKLQAEKRQVTGRKVKTLRSEGVLPANIYGKKIKSQSVQVDLKSFLPIFQQVGETGVVNLQLKGETTDRPVLIHNVQLHPVSDQPLHADFYQVSLKEKVTTEIPVELVGESPAVKEKIGILIQPLAEVEVEALPTELPDKFEVDIGKLEKVDDSFIVADLKVPAGVKILTNTKEILASIQPLAKEEKVAPPVEEAAEGKVPAEEAAETEAQGKEEKSAPEEGAANQKPGKKPEDEKSEGQ